MSTVTILDELISQNSANLANRTGDHAAFRRRATGDRNNESGTHVRHAGPVQARSDCQLPTRQGGLESARSLPQQPLSPGSVDSTLRKLPSSGWASGWTGRRDRALLVLSQMAGLSFDNIAELTVGDISVAEGVAIIRTPGGTTTLHSADDALICGPCALARWVRALDLTSVYPNTCVVAAVIARAPALTPGSPHLCEGTVTVTDATRSMPILPGTDQWGLLEPRVRTAPGSTGPGSTAPGRTVLGKTASGKTASGKAASTSATALQPPTTFDRRAPRPAGGDVALRRSNYSRADRERPVAQSDAVAHRLAGRTRQLLDHDRLTAS